MQRTGIASLLVCAVTAAAAASGQEPTPGPAVTPHASGRTVRSPGNATWAGSLEEARARAAKHNELVYVEFGSEQCGQCHRMEGLLYPAFDFEALLVGMVPVRVPLDSPDGKKLGEFYGVTEEPSVLITTPQGRLVFLMQGFQDVGDFFTHARRDLDSYRQFARVVDAQDVAKLPAADAYKTGSALYARFDYAGAARRLERAASAPDGSPALRADALMGLASAERQLGHLEPARRAAQKVIASTANPDQKERAELLVAEIALEENRLSDALADYRKFAKDHPKSPYLEKVRGFIARLEAAEPKS